MVSLEQFIPAVDNDICVLGDYTLDTFQIIIFDIMWIFHHKTFSIPIEFCITIMTTDMNMDRLMLAGEEHENKTKLSE